MNLDEAKLRIARATDDLSSVVSFYRDGLGFEILSSFEDHEGFDGVMLGHTSSQYHLEFTRHRGQRVGKAPSEENLLIFYLPEPDDWRRAVDRLIENGYQPVKSHNPYWDRHGRTFADPDGYRVVLHNAAWPG